MSLEDKLKEIKSRCEAATEGPWNYREGLGWCDVYGHPYLHNDGTHISSKFNPATSQKATHKFIAHARTDIPILLEMVTLLSHELREALVHLDDSETIIEVRDKCEKIAEKYESPNATR